MPKGTVIVRVGGCCVRVWTVLDQTYMDFIGTKFQEKQKRFLLLLEPLDDWPQASQRELISRTGLVKADDSCHELKVCLCI